MAATLEMESYASSRAGTIATLQEESSAEEENPLDPTNGSHGKGHGTRSVLERQQSIQPTREVKSGQSSAGRFGGRRSRGVVCWNCQLPGHLACNCRSTQQGN